MAAFSRGVRSFLPKQCPRCVQRISFSTTPTIQSGHSRWSKIKHDKGAVDSKRSARNSMYSKEIAQCSKVYGGDVNNNPKLAALCAIAKKAGFSKASMEAAIARGQGKSLSGRPLESFNVEAILPSTIATIIEVETDGKTRTMMELNMIIKHLKGNNSPITFLFQKRGRIAFEKDERNLTVDDVLDEAIEAGAEDVEADEDGSIIVWTEASNVTSAIQALQKSLELKVESSDIIWDSNEDTRVHLTEDSATALSEFLDMLEDNPAVQAVYANVARGELSEEAWEALSSRLAA